MRVFGLALCGAIAVLATGVVAPRGNHAASAPRPALSAMAAVGRQMFFDPRLSASGKLSCASCHDPDHAYGPPDDRAVALGGVTVHDEGRRAVPSLRYIDRIPPFGFGPDVPEASEKPQIAARRAALVPRGGLFWDGRANTLQQQALGPLLNPIEMANADLASVARTIRSSAYARRLAALTGEQAIAVDDALVGEAMFAIARFEIEDESFHPYSSKYDAYLRGAADLSPAERRGLSVFENPAKGNCAACHLDRRTPDGRPPAFSDYQYEALGVPRNDRLAANRDSSYVDLGLCGPMRADLRTQSKYCGMFRTPSLRNVATRRAFFHNGVFHTLEDVVAFYNARDAQPDLPPHLAANADVRDPPFDRKPAEERRMDAHEMHDLIAFLRTLNDGYLDRP